MASWLDRYLTFTGSLESPRLFHLWSAIGVVGHVLGRNVWFTRGGFIRLYPGQLMVVLVSRSAMTKKTTAIVTAAKFLKSLEPWQYNWLPKKMSPQSLLFNLQRLNEDKLPARGPDNKRLDSIGLVVAGELGTFFSTEAFCEALATHISDLNDAPDGRVNIEFRSWKAELWNPVVGILGGITPKGMAEELPKAARSAGFFGRVLWVTQHDTDRANSLTTIPPDLREQRLALQADLREIAELRGPFRYTKQAREWMDDWYYQVHVPHIKTLASDISSETGYWGRKDSHLHRVGMVLSACDPATRRSRTITRAIMESSLKHLEDIERFFPQAMKEIGVSPWSEYERRVLDLLEKSAARGKHWMAEDRILREVWRHGGNRRFDEALDTLLRAREIERKRDGDKMYLRRRFSSGHQLRSTSEQKVSLRVLKGGRKNGG